MSIRDLKKCLSESLDMQEELFEFIEECLRQIYPEENEYNIMKYRFYEGVNGYEDMGCIQSLHCLMNNRENEKKKANATKDE